jgi:UDP-3-O-acyl-N-acetylglucosamine deacetylase
MLDLVGDLALCGERFEAQVTAVRPSHRMNVELARALRARFLGERKGRGGGEERHR